MMHPFGRLVKSPEEGQEGCQCKKLEPGSLRSEINQKEPALGRPAPRTHLWDSHTKRETLGGTTLEASVSYPDRLLTPIMVAPRLNCRCLACARRKAQILYSRRPIGIEELHGLAAE